MAGAKALSAAMLIGTAVHGISKGIGQSDVSSAFYELATGNPDIDQEVFGTNVGMRELFLPIPGPFTRLSAIKRGGFEGVTAAWDAGLLNGKILTDKIRQNNEPLYTQSSGAPKVDGSLVFALKNSSLA